MVHEVRFRNLWGFWQRAAAALPSAYPRYRSLKTHQRRIRQAFQGRSSRSRKESVDRKGGLARLEDRPWKIGNSPRRCTAAVSGAVPFFRWRPARP